MSVEEKEGFEPKILVFACNWCTYAGADLAGLSRLQYPPNVRILRVPCSGRVNPQFVLRAFQRGIDGVLSADATQATATIRAATISRVAAIC